jgi:hypothetical protein
LLLFAAAKVPPPEIVVLAVTNTPPLSRSSVLPLLMARDPPEKVNELNVVVPAPAVCPPDVK